MQVFTKQITNTYLSFAFPLPTKVVFDFDLGLQEYSYISPIASDTEGDKVIMEFGGIEDYNFIVMR